MSGGCATRFARPPASGPTRSHPLTKLIFWLVGLLLAIVTMNVTAYLLLTGTFLAIKGVAKLKMRQLLKPPPPPPDE
jgi:energy-coupling factor transporter transmembrane protein EcfT